MRTDLRRASELTPDRMSAAALCVLLGVLAYLLLGVVLPPTARELLASDPLIRLFPRAPGTWTVALIPLGAASAWVFTSKIERSTLKDGIGYGLAGTVAGLAVTLAIRALHGDVLPSFVPSEESSAPGMSLGFGAGLLEEGLFRLGTLPLLYFALRRRISPSMAAVVACLGTGLAFAVSHELGPGAGAFDATHFVTRALVPGAAMSAVAVLVHPAFMVAAHCAAHIAIALLFHAPAV